MRADSWRRPEKIRHYCGSKTQGPTSICARPDLTIVRPGPLTEDSGAVRCEFVKTWTARATFPGRVAMYIAWRVDFQDNCDNDIRGALCNYQWMRRWRRCDVIVFCS